MSLCQSLRQYVFVHRAIIEGALMIVDEEKRRDAVPSSSSSTDKPRVEPRTPSKRALRAAGLALTPQRAVSRKRSAPDFDSDDLACAEASPRRASPAACADGGAAHANPIAKRPSLKRRQRASGVPSEALAMAAVAPSTPPPGA